ncbi:MAG: tetratricopeptide repeat protein, partial [Candidatus Muiribacteriota bacterium]
MKKFISLFIFLIIFIYAESSVQIQNMLEIHNQIQNQLNTYNQNLIIEQEINKKITRNFEQNFNTLDSLIEITNNTLLFLDYAEDEQTYQSVEGLYNYLLNSLSEYSENLAERIVDEIKNRNYIPINIYYEKIKERKQVISGYYFLNQAIYEKLERNALNRQIIAHLEYFNKIINSTSWISNIGNKLKESIQNYGNKTALWQATLLWEYTEHNDSKKYKKWSKIVDKAFVLYGYLNNKFCIDKRADEPTPQDIYSEANDAYYDGNYSLAISKFNQVISMDYYFATQNGCYYYIGRCYRELSQYSSAFNYYKESMLKDSKEPYQKYSYDDIKSMYLYDMGKTEAVYLEFDVKLNNLLSIGVTDSWILNDIRITMAEIYENHLYRLDEIPDNRKKEYLYTAIEKYREYITNYKPEGSDYSYHATVDEAELKIAEIYSNKLLKFAQDNNEKEELYLKSIEICKKVIETGMVESVIEKAYSKITSDYWSVSNLFSYFVYAEREKKRIYLETGVLFGETYMQTYINGKYNKQIANQLGSNNYILIFSYYLSDSPMPYEIEKKGLDSIKWYKYVADNAEYPSDIYIYYTFKSTTLDTLVEYFDLIEMDDSFTQKYLNQSIDFHSRILSGEIDTGGFVTKNSAFEKIGHCFSIKKEYTNAIENYKKALEHNPDSKEAKEQLAEVYIEIEEFEKAEILLNELLNNTVNWAAYDKLGDIYYIKKEYNKAYQYYLKADESADYLDFYPNIQGKIAKTLCKLGDYNKSLEKMNELLVGFFDTKFWLSDKELEKDKSLYQDLLKIEITPAIYEMDINQTITLTAQITYPDSNEPEFKNKDKITWNWELKNPENFTLIQNPEKPFTAELRFFGEIFTPPDITVKAKFNIDEVFGDRKNHRIVSKEIEITGRMEELIKEVKIISHKIGSSEETIPSDEHITCDFNDRIQLTAIIKTKTGQNTIWFVPPGFLYNKIKIENKEYKIYAKPVNDEREIQVVRWNSSNKLNINFVWNKITPRDRHQNINLNNLISPSNDETQLYPFYVNPWSANPRYNYGYIEYEEQLINQGENLWNINAVTEAGTNWYNVKVELKREERKIIGQKYSSGKFGKRTYRNLNNLEAEYDLIQDYYVETHGTVTNDAAGISKNVMRVSRRGNYENDFINEIAAYINVPYVLGAGPAPLTTEVVISPEYNQTETYKAADCSKLPIGAWRQLYKGITTDLPDYVSANTIANATGRTIDYEKYWEFAMTDGQIYNDPAMT